MTPLIAEVETAHSPETLVESLQGVPGVVLLESSLRGVAGGRYSFVAAQPFLVLRTRGAHCESRMGGRIQSHFGNPWQVLEGHLSRCELLEQIDLPFPLGGCIGYWGFELKDWLEPCLTRRAARDLDVPDCVVGFYSSLVAFDHLLGKTWIISTGLTAEGSRQEVQARKESQFWRTRLQTSTPDRWMARGLDSNASVRANLSRTEFVARVNQARDYIQAGDIYQVNLAQRLSVPWTGGGWPLYQRLSGVSPAPFAAYLDCGSFQIASSSPELFLRLSGRRITTRPIKGTRPRAADTTRDMQLAYELQTSPKELAELVMITDLLRNDLGRICEYGSIAVPELVRLERYAHVQHLVSTVEGRLQPDVSHLAALAACFPGGSITGAPKIRALQIIDELEPVARGPYTGCLGYLGFNGESQLSILIRAAVCVDNTAFFHVGAGIVADSDPVAEYEETLAKAGGFFQSLALDRSRLERVEALSSAVESSRAGPRAGTADDLNRAS